MQNIWNDCNLHHHTHHYHHHHHNPERIHCHLYHTKVCNITVPTSGKLCWNTTQQKYSTGWRNLQRNCVFIADLSNFWACSDILSQCCLLLWNNGVTHKIVFWLLFYGYLDLHSSKLQQESLVYKPNGKYIAKDITDPRVELFHQSNCF